MKNSHIIDLINHFNISKIIIVLEHNAFKEKLLMDFELPDNVEIISYSGRTYNFFFFKLFYKFFFTKTLIIGEYYNLIPRIVTLITNSRSISILYGITNELKVKSPKFYLRLINKLFCPFYADSFLIINRISTKKIFEKKFGTTKVNFLKLKRNNFSKANEIYSIWISQCWIEDGLNEIEIFQKSCINKLSSLTNLVIVKHPRDKVSKYNNSNLVLDNMSEATRYFKAKGQPANVFGIASSALLELHDCGLNVIRVENKSTRQFVDGIIEIEALQSITKNQIINYI